MQAARSSRAQGALVPAVQGVGCHHRKCASGVTIRLLTQAANTIVLRIRSLGQPYIAPLLDATLARLRYCPVGRDRAVAELRVHHKLRLTPANSPA